MAFISKQVHSFSSSSGGDIQTPATSPQIPLWYDDDMITTTTTSSGKYFFDNYNYGMITTLMPPEYDITIPSWNKSSSTLIIPAERFGVLQEMVVPTSPTGQFTSNVNILAGGAHHDYQKVEQDHEYFCNSDGYATNSSWSSNYPTATATATATNSWEAESQKTSKEIEEPTTTLKIGRYSTEERKDKIMKYLKKRNQRNFNKTIKYECRKTLADKRIRVRGRFAKNNNDHHHDHHQPCEDQVLPSISTNNNSYEEDIQNLYSNNFLIKQDYDEEEEWLQEAMASLLYSPKFN